MKRSDLGIAALGGLLVTGGCSPQNRTSFDPPIGGNAAGAVSPAANTTLITTMALYDLKIGTVMKFTVYHDRAVVITVIASNHDMIDVKTVKKHATATHVFIKVIADGSSGLQVLSDGRDFLAFAISTKDVP